MNGDDDVDAGVTSLFLFARPVLGDVPPLFLFDFISDFLKFASTSYGNSGVTHCFMESSSHAIVQRRIAGLDYDGAVFTNISHDHLDYHKTFDEYIKAKKQLFDTFIR